MNSSNNAGLDPLLERAFGALREDPIADPDWDTLHASIMHEAEAILSPSVGRFGRRLPTGFVSLAAAAGIAVVLWALPQMDGGQPIAQNTDFSDELVDERVFLDALAEDITETEFRMLITGRSNPEAMLAVAVSGR